MREPHQHEQPDNCTLQVSPVKGPCAAENGRASRQKLRRQAASPLCALRSPRLLLHCRGSGALGGRGGSL